MFIQIRSMMYIRPNFKMTLIAFMFFLFALTFGTSISFGFVKPIDVLNFAFQNSYNYVVLYCIIISLLSFMSCTFLISFMMYSKIALFYCIIILMIFMLMLDIVPLIHFIYVYISKYKVIFPRTIALFFIHLLTFVYYISISKKYYLKSN